MNKRKGLPNSQKVTPFQCDECGKYLTTKSGLEYHSRTHSGYKPYTCSVCSKDFISVSSLNQHKWVHVATKRYECDCGQEFILRSRYNNHLKKCNGFGMTVPYDQIKKPKKIIKNKTDNIVKNVKTEFPLEVHVKEEKGTDNGDEPRYSNQFDDMFVKEESDSS